jgi:hypothetical protein
MAYFCKKFVFFFRSGYGSMDAGVLFQSANLINYLYLMLNSGLDNICTERFGNKIRCLKSQPFFFIFNTFKSGKNNNRDMLGSFG